MSAAEQNLPSNHLDSGCEQRASARRKRARNPMRPLEAWRGIRKLIRNPDDTAQVFRIIRALSGDSLERGFHRFLASALGPRILAEKRSLVDRLSDRESLEALPEGTLGRVYVDFVKTEEITPGGLVDASEDASPDGRLETCPDRILYGERLRDQHDLWHVVTGYGRDLVGEAALLAFTYQQTRNRGIGFIVAVAYLRAGKDLPQERPMIRDGYRRSKSASWLPGADWEALLEVPLPEVRRILGVEPVSDYDRVRSQGAPVIA